MCFAIIDCSAFQFKKTVEEGQARLAGVIKQRREAKERMERMEQERRQQQAQVTVLWPFLTCYSFFKLL